MSGEEKALSVSMPDTKKLTAEASETLAFAREATVEDDTSYKIVGEFVVGLKKLEVQINETFDGPIKKQREALEAMREAKKRHSDPIQEAAKILNEKLVAYRKVAEQKRLALEKELAEKAAADAKAAREAEEKKLAADGKPEEAKALAARPVSRPTIVLASTLPKIKGLSAASTWDYKIVDESKIPRAYLMVDTSKIRGVVNSMKKNAEELIPGIEVFDKEGIRRGTR